MTTRMNIIAGAGCAILTVGSAAASYEQARVVERYVFTHCYDQVDFQWSFKGNIAAHRSPTGRWDFHPSRMIKGMFAPCVQPQEATGLPTRIMIAAPFLKMGV